MATINLFPNDTVQVDTLVDANGGTVAGIPQKTYAELVVLINAANAAGSGSSEYIALDGTYMEVTSGASQQNGKLAVILADNGSSSMTSYWFNGNSASYSQLYPVPNNN